MSEVSRFGHEEFGTIRTVDVDGEVWFVAKDVTDALGYREAYDALESHVRPGQRANRVVAGAGSGIAANRRMAVVNEGGLYRLIMRSNLPGADAFQDWVTDEVLPQIRKTGSYNVPGTPGSFAEALELAAKQQREIETMAPRVELLELFEDKREGFSIADAGALFGYKPHLFHEVMRTWGATYRNESGNTCASHFWVKKGWLKRRNAVTPAVTPMGLAEIERRLGRKAVG